MFSKIHLITTYTHDIFSPFDIFTKTLFLHKQLGQKLVDARQTSIDKFARLLCWLFNKPIVAQENKYFIGVNKFARHKTHFWNGNLKEFFFLIHLVSILKKVK